LLNLNVQYCSLKCSAANPETKQKRKTTSLTKYGTENAAAAAVTKQKTIETCLAKYGTTNPAKTQDAKTKISNALKASATERLEKAKETIKHRYGVEHPSQIPEVKEKKKQTFRNNYGVDHYFQSTEFKDYSYQYFTRVYGVANPAQSASVIKKIKETKQQRYGIENYNNQSKALSTMKAVYGDHYSRLHWSDQLKHLLNSVGSLTELMNENTVNSVANQLGIAATTLRAYLRKNNIENFCGRVNQYESLVESLLDDNNINYVKNDRTVLNGLELDFFIPDKRLAIEINGIFWHSELMGKSRSYHKNKTDMCEQQGIRLVHLWDYQIDSNPELICSMIKVALGIVDCKIHARSTNVKECTADEYWQFLEKNHIAKHVNSSVKLGLYYNSQLVSVMGLGVSRFKNSEYELYRFATKQNTLVVGGASKLLQYFFKQHPECKRLISFADRDISAGNVYERLGFVRVQVLPPSYKYFKNRTVYNRLQFQKHRLEKVLEYFDKELSEWENMKINKFNRFWNSGQIKYEYTPRKN
jgi:very-short-patch-repair endonuclease